MKTQIVTRTEYVPYEKSVKVIEQKAPTDESIRLFKELREKALSSVTDGFKLNNNIIDGVVIATDEKFDFRGYVFRSRFKVNGVEYKTETEIPYYEYMALSKEDRKHRLIKFLIESIAERVTYQMLLSVGKDFSNSLKFTNLV